MQYAIGDVHGCIKTLRLLVEEKIQLTKNDLLVLVGDYIDRGPDSKAVLDYLMKLKEDGYDVIPLRGNHDQMMVDAYMKKDSFSSTLWLNNGAQNTIDSFMPDIPTEYYEMAIGQIPEKYIQFIQSMPFYHELEDYLLVHGGFDWSSADPFSDTRGMLWEREPSNNIRFTKGRAIIHGHTPTPSNIIKNNPGSSVINIDSGCVYTHIEDLGNLTAFNMDTREFFIVSNQDRGKW